MSKYDKLPSVSSLRSFEAAARHESYTMAAEELGVTQGAISRQVRELEGVIGARLFRRVGRAVRLTDTGRSLFASLARDLEHLRDTINRAVAAGQGATTLSVAVLPTFAARWLVPRLPEFKLRQPDIEFILESRSAPFDLESERFDLAIHFGRADWPGAQLTPLCPEYLVAVASPALIDQYGLIEAANVFDAPLLHLTSRSFLWARYNAQLGAPERTAFPGPRFDQFTMLISGAVAGLGAAILPTYLIEAELASGALAQIGKVASPKDEGYFIATPAGAKNQNAKRFSDWMKRQVLLSDVFQEEAREY